MDRAKIKPEIPESLMTDEMIHYEAGTDLTISALYYSGTNCEDVTELKIESQMTNSVENEDKMVDDFIDPSSGMLSGLIVIAPQEDNYHKYDISINGRPDSPDHQKEFKQDTAIPPVKQEMIDPVMKKDETGDISMDGIDHNQIIKEEILDCKESIKLEDDMSSSFVDNLNDTEKTEGQSVVKKNVLCEERFQEDFVKSKRFDGDLGQSEDQVPRGTVKPRNHPMSVLTTSSDESSDCEKSHSLSSCKEFVHKKKKNDALILKCQQHRNRRWDKVDKLKESEEFLSFKDEPKEYQITHTGKEPCVCTMCDKSFYDQYKLRCHQTTHTGEKPYGCTMSHLKVHQRIHKAEKPHACTMCHKCFKASYALKIHQRTHTGEKPYGCTMCDKSFSNQGDLKLHQRTHTGEKPYECNMCDKSFSNHSNLKRHERTHTGEKPYGCTLCDVRFKRLDNLKFHQRIHTGEKPYGCTMCDKCFMASSDLQRHQRIHTGEKPYKCSICDKSFRNQSNLTVHHRIHTGEKPYECTLCDKRFAAGNSLQHHQRTHTGEGSNGFPHCGGKFACSNNMNTHTLTHKK